MPKVFNKPKISVFVPTGGRSVSLKKCLKSLTEQSFKDFEVIIVDYKSNNHTLSVIHSFSKKININLVNQTKKGLSLAANMALKVARGTIFIRTDDDVIMGRGWLEAINETFDSDRKIGGVTGPTVVPKSNINARDLFFYTKKFKKGNIFFKIFGLIYFNYFMEGKPFAVGKWFKSGAFSIGSNYKNALREPIQEVENLEACNFSVKTSLLKKIGGFDQSYSGVGEYHEPDAACKIKKLGYKLIFNPKVSINHCPSQDGFFNDRPNSYSRMENFITFHSRYIKKETLGDYLRYISYLIFLNMFYVYLGIKQKQANQFSAIPGTISGLLKGSRQ